MSFDFSISALDLAALLRSKEVSPVEVVDRYLQRADELNPRLNAITYRCDDEVRKAARVAEARLSKGTEPLPPFLGVPIPIKALTSVAGWPMNQCSRAAEGNIELVNHDIVNALQEAGFLLLYQTTSPELGSIPVTESALYGATRNPWNLEHSPGGSSGGAGACVAAGLAPIAEGSDGGGSIRIPASCCGLVGLKPSRGRVWVGPVYTDSFLATKGVLSRTVSDTAALLDVLQTRDPYQWNVAPPEEESFLSGIDTPPGRLRIGFTADSPLGGPVDDECRKAVEDTAKLLSDLGHEVFEAAPQWDPVQEFVDNFFLVWAALLGDFRVSRDDLIEPHNRELQRRAFETDCTKYRLAVQALQTISRRVASAWPEKFDVLLTPTLGKLPPKVGEILAEADQDPTASFFRCFDLVPFTVWFNCTGQPAISLPARVSPENLPVGVQLVGPPWGERLLLRLAKQIESASSWPTWQETP